MKDENNTTGLFNTLQLLQAYEQAIDENIISSITDTFGTIVHANKKFCEISQYSVDEVIGQNHSIINSGYHTKTFFKNLWDTIENGKVWHNEIKNKAKDGTNYWVDTVIVPVKDQNGKNTHYLSLRTLITTRKQLEKNKENYVSSLEVLLVMTSNKVKKPLSDCLIQINKFDPKKSFAKSEFINILDNLKLSANELDNFTKELNLFIREMEK
ncbi:MAG: PAS domain S-box protein [Bacteroidia bacterium]|nr:PAS domain S-box protein [Bacteroidia bacterium]